MPGTGQNREKEHIHFQAPPRLAERTDTLATVLEKTRTAVITEALGMYIDDQIQREDVDRQIGAAFYDDHISMDQLVALVGPDAAAGFLALKRKLADDPRDLPDPSDGDTGGYPPDFEPETAPSNE